MQVLPEDAWAQDRHNTNFKRPKWMQSDSSASLVTIFATSIRLGSKSYFWRLLAHSVFFLDSKIVKWGDNGGSGQIIVIS